jgi:hypothetical protein
MSTESNIATAIVGLATGAVSIALGVTRFSGRLSS